MQGKNEAIQHINYQSKNTLINLIRVAGNNKLPTTKLKVIRPRH